MGLPILIFLIAFAAGGVAAAGLLPDLAEGCCVTSVRSWDWRRPSNLLTPRREDDLPRVGSGRTFGMSGDRAPGR
jgi:hypothetical protein